MTAIEEFLNKTGTVYTCRNKGFEWWPNSRLSNKTYLLVCKIKNPHGVYVRKLYTIFKNISLETFFANINMTDMYFTNYAHYCHARRIQITRRSFTQFHINNREVLRLREMYSDVQRIELKIAMHLL